VQGGAVWCVGCGVCSAVRVMRVGVVRGTVVWCGVVQCVWYGAVWCGAVWCVWCGVVWGSAVWCGVVCAVQCVWCGMVRCLRCVWCGAVRAVHAVWCGKGQCGAVWCVWCGACGGVRCMWCGAMWCGVVGCVRCTIDCAVHQRQSLSSRIEAGFKWKLGRKRAEANQRRKDKKWGGRGGGRGKLEGEKGGKSK
jgi:hypothetical protein